MRFFIFATYIFSSLTFASTSPVVNRVDIQNSIKEDLFAARGQREAAQALLVFKETRQKRVEKLYARNAASLSELEFARAERAAISFLISALQGEEDTNAGRLKLFAYMGKPKEQIDPKVVAEMTKAIEEARCRKAGHRRDVFGAYADYYTREGKRNEVLLRKNAISLEQFQQNDSKRLEQRALERAWVDFLQGCPSSDA